MLSIIMTVFTIVMFLIIALGGLIGFFKGWKKCLIGLCRTVIAAVLSFIIVLIISSAIPGSSLFGMFGNQNVEFLSDSTATQDLLGNIIYSVFMPFLFVWLFVILDLLLLIPAHFVGKAMGCYPNKKKSEEKNTDNVSANQLNYNYNLGNAAPVQEAEAETDKKQEENTDKKRKPCPPIVLKFIGCGIKAITTTIVILLVLFPITGIITTFSGGIDNIMNTAATLNIKIHTETKDAKFKDYTLTDSEGILNIEQTRLLVDDYVSPVTDNVFVVMSSKGPMRLVYNGLSGSRNAEGKSKNEFDQVFDLCCDALYLTVDLESFGQPQKDAVNRIFGYLAQSETHSAVSADILSYIAKNTLEDKTSFGADLSSVKEGPGAILMVPLFEKLATTNTERVKTDVITLRDALIITLDYKLPAQFAVAMSEGNAADAYHVLANENMLGDLLVLLYHNEDFHDLTAPSINFLFTVLIRSVNHEIESVDVTDAKIDSLTDEELRNEAKILASLIDNINSVSKSIEAISESNDAMHSIANADMAAIGSFAETAQHSIFLGEGVNEFLVAMLSSEGFNSMREAANILIHHIETDDDLHIKNLMVALQQFVNILNVYDKTEGHNTAELAVTLGELNKTLDPSTAAIMKEIINDTDLLTSTSLDAGGKENTSSQKMMSVFVDKLATEEFTEEQLEKEAKALDYSMQLIQASSSDDGNNSIKEIYNDKEGMNEMVATMADSKISSAAINEIAYVDGNPDNGLSEDALELSSSMDDEDRVTLVEECENYYKQEAAKEGCDITTLKTNVKAIAAVFGQDITENITAWDSELAA